MEGMGNNYVLLSKTTDYFEFAVQNKGCLCQDHSTHVGKRRLGSHSSVNQGHCPCPVAIGASTLSYCCQLTFNNSYSPTT